MEESLDFSIHSSKGNLPPQGTVGWLGEEVLEKGSQDLGLWYVILVSVPGGRVLFQVKCCQEEVILLFGIISV